MISLGHDEYDSQAMWDALVAAETRRDEHRLPRCEAMYRHIRPGPRPIGPDPLEPDYKDASMTRS